MIDKFENATWIFEHAEVTTNISETGRVHVYINNVDYTH